MNEQTKSVGVKSFSVPAALIRAAMIFQARRDPRHYLNGIHINANGHIEGTNGHIMFRAECEEAKTLDESLIVSINGKVPARAHMAKFTFADDERDVGLLVFEDGHGKPLRRGSVIDGRAFERLDGKFPDCAKVVPDKPIKATEKFCVNAAYMAKVADAAKAIGIGYPIVTVNLRGELDLLEIDLSGPEYKAKCLIMPARA